MIELKDKLIGFDDEDFVGDTKKPIKILIKIEVIIIVKLIAIEINILE